MGLSFLKLTLFVAGEEPATWELVIISPSFLLTKKPVPDPA